MKLEDKSTIENPVVDNTTEAIEEIKNAPQSSFIQLPKATYSYSFISVIIIAIVAAIWVLLINLNSAHVTITANFSEIADGLSPDGSPFEIHDVLSDEVLQSACEKLNNRIELEELRKHISVTGITNDGTFNAIKQNVLDGNDTYSYFPSKYTITYSIISDAVVADGILSSIGAVAKQVILPSKTKILRCVAESYREYYENRYVITSKIFDIDWEKTRSLDHYNRTTEMTNILNRLNRYLGKRYDEDVEFVSKSGFGFGDLSTEVSKIIQNDVASYKSYIIQSGVSADKEKLLKQFRYMLGVRTDQMTRNRGQHDIMLDGIGKYDANITKVAFIPALDSDNIFYMNRTKVGIDYLTEDASKAKLLGDEAENEAYYYTYLITQFGNNATPEWMLKDADKRCEAIIAKINDLCEKATIANDEYIDGVSCEKLELSKVYYGKGFVSSVVAIIKITVIWAALLYVLWVAFSTLRKKYDDSEEGKNAD